MTLRQAIIDDAEAVFTSTDDFAEVVTYKPHRFYGEALRADREINAVVIRNQITVITEDGDTVAAQWEVHVINDSTTGISSEELDLGGDMIELPPRDGKDAEARSITRLISQDLGMLVVECL